MRHAVVSVPSLSLVWWPETTANHPRGKQPRVFWSTSLSLSFPPAFELSYELTWSLLLSLVFPMLPEGRLAPRALLLWSAPQNPSGAGPAAEQPLPTPDSPSHLQITARTPSSNTPFSFTSQLLSLQTVSKDRDWLPVSAHLSQAHVWREPQDSSSQTPLTWGSEVI